MSEEEVTLYLERLSIRGQELMEDAEKAHAVLESAGICDHEGNLTELYK